MDHLCASEGFLEQGDLASAMRTDVPTILANTDSVGGAQAKLGTRSEQRRTTRSYRTSRRARFANQLVATWPTVDCPNDHLRRTFLHPDVQARGCTRIEVSLYACRRRDLSANTAKEVVEEALALVSPLGSARPICSPTTPQAVGEPGRLPRPVSRPSRPAAGLDIHRLVHAHDNRPGLGSLGRAHQGKRRQRGNMGDGRRMGLGCPIFRVDILGANEEGVELGPLRCYTKDADAGTILAASKRPTQLHPNGPDPGYLLPPSTSVSWIGGGQQEPGDWQRSRPSAQNCTGPRYLYAPDQEPRKAPPTDLRLGERRRLAATCLGPTREQRRRAEEIECLSQLVAAHRRYAEESRHTGLGRRRPALPNGKSVGHAHRPQMARSVIQTFERSNGAESCVVRSNNRRQQRPRHSLCVGNAGARKGARRVRRHL